MLVRDVKSRTYFQTLIIEFQSRHETKRTGRAGSAAAATCTTLALLRQIATFHGAEVTNLNEGALRRYLVGGGGVILLVTMDRFTFACDVSRLSLSR